MQYIGLLIYRILIVFIVCMSLPFLCVIGAGVALTAGFPIFYSQWRVGKNGKKFLLYKFRTMSVGAHRQQNKLAKWNEARGPVFKIHNDPRFTPIGKFLSHTGLDELPQLFNVLRGDMAIIGPRPLPVTEAKRLTTKQFARHMIKPGIISPWILEGYHHASFELWMNKDLAYVHEKSLPKDAMLFLKAVVFFFTLLTREIKRVLYI